MASDFHKIYHISGKEFDVWNTFFNEHNLEKAFDLDSRKGMHPRLNHEFKWEIDGRTVEGKIVHIDTPDSASTKIAFEWRFDDEDLNSIWLPDHYAVTTLLLGDQTETTYIEMWITEIPGGQGEQDRARKLWGEKILRKLDTFLRGNPEIERAS